MLMSEISLIYPEMFTAVAACIILLVDVFCKRGAFTLSMLALILVAIITLTDLPTVSQTIFSGSFVVDRFASILKLVLYALLALIFVYSRLYIQVRDFFHGEFFVLSLLSMLGMMILISSSNFLSMYLGLELLVLPLYAMIVMVKHDSKYPEAAMKYFVIGSLGAGILLYGISFIYAATGSFAFTSVVSSVSAPMTLQLGVLFIIAGLALEFAAVPFHMWLPDVYEGSPTAVTMIIGTLPKVAVFAITYRLLTIAFVDLSPEWTQLFIALSILSLGFGNIVAIAQQNIKRMLAYSTIGHIGFILLGLFVAQKEGYVAAIYYVIVYVFMSLAAFAVIMRLSAKGFEADRISDYAGLSKRAPWLAFVMLLIMFSLAGVPPLVGFYAKLLVLQNVVDAGYPLLAVFALIFSVIGAFYYLWIIKVMYFDEPLESRADLPAHGMSRLASTVLSGHGLLLLIFGVFPGTLLLICMKMLS